MKTRFLVLALLGWLCHEIAVATAQDAFSENVRQTEPLSPEQQLQSFQVPADLTVDLIAAEPAIQKPLNLAFDVRGRLWVTCTVEYPYPAADGQGRDRIVVLEDTNGDGQFDQQTDFASDLNIPIGILPGEDDCIVFDIPYIWRLSDTDGDGRCDHKVRLLGPFDCSRDTHGMNNSFIQGFDGWIYACHGFANRSQVAGADGHQVTLNSGNVYRFRPDGGRIEHFSHGQVNPYGMACDDWFALFTADCHSKPLTQVLRGAYYPSFGAPHDGLGFAPSMMEHFHGSTAIAGVEVLTGQGLPTAYRGQLVSGNVMTSRINRNRLAWDGARAEAIELPDLVSTTDPWFRPVNLIQGPDAGLYIADFYNRIIGHYEVPLEHPGRDRVRGRIWRVRAAQLAEGEPPRRWNKGDTAAARDFLWDLLKRDQVRTRLAALNALVALAADRPEDAQWLVKRSLEAIRQAEDSHGVVAGLWCLVRVAPTQVDEVLLRQLQAHEAAVVRGHVQRVLAEIWPGGNPTALPATGADRSGGGNGQDVDQAADLSWERIATLPLTADVVGQLVAAGMADPDPRVVQLAADAAGRNPAVRLLPSLVALAADSQRDPAVRHTARMALKHSLGAIASSPVRGSADNAAAGDELWHWVRTDGFANQHRSVLAGVMLALPRVEAADYLLDYLAGGATDEPQSSEMIQHIAKHLPMTRATDLVQMIRARFAGDNGRQWELLGSVREGLARSGQPTPTAVREWALQLVQEGLATIANQGPSWQAWTLEGRPPAQPTEEAWRVQSRPAVRRRAADSPADSSADARTDARTDAPLATEMFSSLPAGEQRTGRLRSPDFLLPESLTMAVAGHRGYPDQPAHELNRIRLVLADGTVLQTAFPPRHDIASWIHWDLKPWLGQSGYLEIQDGDSAGAYAWLAVGAFDPPVVSVPARAPGELSTYVRGLGAVASGFRLTEVLPELERLLRPDGLLVGDRWVIAQAAAELKSQGFAGRLATELSGENLPAETREELLRLIGAWRPECLAEPPPGTAVEGEAREAAIHGYLLNLLPKLSGRQQKLLVRAALHEAEVFQTLLDWAESGRLSAESFTDATVQQQLTLADRGDWAQRIQALLESLPPTDEAWVSRARQVEQRFKPWLAQLKQGQSVTSEQVELDSELARQWVGEGQLQQWKQLGQQVFQRDCAACHQLAGQGAVVGPQLDGIHRRGLERVLEDVLLPNQNVDHAFRSQLFLLESGQVLVGLVQAEDQVSIQLTDQQGKTTTVPVARIDQRQVTPQSLMPGDVAHQYSDATLFGLMCFLMEQDR